MWTRGVARAALFFAGLGRFSLLRNDRLLRPPTLGALGVSLEQSMICTTRLLQRMFRGTNSLSSTCFFTTIMLTRHKIGRADIGAESRGTRGRFRLRAADASGSLALTFLVPCRH